MDDLTKKAAIKMDYILSLGVDKETVSCSDDIKQEMLHINKLENLGFLKVISKDFYIVTYEGIEFYKNGGFKKIYNDQTCKYDLTQGEGVLIFKNIREVKIYKWISLIALVISISTIIFSIFKIF